MQHLQAHEVIDNKYDIIRLQIFALLVGIFPFFSRCLGQGNFAIVSECIDRVTKKHLALKVTMQRGFIRKNNALGD